MTRAPSHIIRILPPLRRECIQIRKLCQSTMFVQIVEESEMRPWITHRCEVFNEGDLHLCAGEEHARVPAELGLALEEKDFGSIGPDVMEAWKGKTGFEGVVEGDCNGERGGAETDADEVVDVRGGGGGRAWGDGGVDGVGTHGCVVVGDDGPLV